MAYATIQDLIDEGLDIPGDLTTERAQDLLDGWSEWIDNKTGQWFESKSLTLLLDGSGSRMLMLDFPIITLTSLYINDSFTTALSTDLYIVYNRYQPDDRKNPRIKLKRSSNSDLYTSVNSNFKFTAGYQNQKLIGDFGYVEEDGSTPFAIQRSVILLTVVTAELITDGELDQLKTGKAIEEVTDRHRIKYSDLYDQINYWGMTGITEVDNAIAMYKRPVKINMPRSFLSV